MCGIVACRRRGDALSFLMPGLRRLEYRGYDSAGVALLDAGDVAVHRAVGRLARLEELLAGLGGLDQPLGIGHTRWATHGAPTEANSHPHRDCSGEIAVVHNGIIENCLELRAELNRAGHQFRSEVDSEVIAHLVEDELARGAELTAAVLTVRRRLRGSWALAVVHAGSGSLVVTAHRSPLLVAEGDDGCYVASDSSAFAGFADEVQVLEDGDLVEVGTDRIRWYDADDREFDGRVGWPVAWSVTDSQLGSYRDYMDKEIAEQPAVVGSLVDRLVPMIETRRLWSAMDLPLPQRVRFVACGSSLNAATAVARVVRVLAGLPVQLVVASEHEEQLVEPGTLTVAFSQSGETADVFPAVDAADTPLLAITNVVSSTLARRADAVLECAAGLEVGVAATKTFTAQVVAGSAFALALARELRPAHGGHADGGWAEAVRSLVALPGQLEEAQLMSAAVVDHVVAGLGDATGFLFVSRGGGLPYAAEGALKLKELTYRWAEVFPAGELKHGPIALIERGTPVIVVEGGDRHKLAGNLSEMRARGASVLTIGSDASSTFPVLRPPLSAPWGPLPAVLPLQHLARSLAISLGCDADKPRNLAKSVTVE